MRHAAFAVVLFSTFATAQSVHTGQDAYRNWDQQKPGERVHLTVKDLPAPNEAESVDNGPEHAPRNGAMPQAPAGFKVQLYAEGGFDQPRLVRTAPNGDLFLADSKAGKVILLRGVKPDGTVAERSEYATGLDHPFGINFYPEKDPKWIYVANTTSIVRFAYKAGDMKASAQPQTIVEKLPGYAQLRGGGHWTRDIAFSLDGKRMFVSVGSGSNVDDPDTHPREFHRADVLEYTPEGKFVKIYASGIRNCVGEAVNPSTGELWCSVNERDRLGNHLVPDYITHVQEGGFYGWPWWYMGGHQDPRHVGKHPELKNKVITPDILVQPHMASLQMTFYTGSMFPGEYKGGIFASEHGSWNRKDRAGYEVIFAPVKNGKATGEYMDFLTGFTTADGKVWGRPVGVTVAKDGSLIVVDDGSKSVWRVTYSGKR
ncbi:MAG: sorbosone dehydrogenase family protein [Acidobacteria bacterium]|nr:sorbosone dehydrogenase family protein [Acidobacteriota bacterium]